MLAVVGIAGSDWWLWAYWQREAGTGVVGSSPVRMDSNQRPHFSWHAARPSVSNPSLRQPISCELVSQAENIRRGRAANAAGLCRRGLHPWTAENVIVELNGVKRCRACRQEYERARGKQRGKGGLPSAERTHCPQNHLYTGDNLYIGPNGHRGCRTCHRERQRARYWRTKTSRTQATS
jgi:hypothetical protein